MDFQFGSPLCSKAFPGIFFRDGKFSIVWWFTEFIGHLQKEKISKLLQIIAVAHAIITQGVTEAPDLTDDA